jgi:hypothetical protein
MNTQGTDGGSVTVALPEIDLTYENDRRALHHARNRIDADSADGHTYSNILELRKNWELCRPGDFAEQHLPRLMLVQERRLVPRNKAMGE